MNVTETSQRLMKNMTPQEVENALRGAQGSRGVSKSRKKSPIGKGKKKISQDPATASNKNTRPLNSYMAFRSYYSTLFSSIQQKEISGFVTYMWQADPFKGLWTILAKAYSAIRDVQGKPNAPLDEFLAINAPLVGIVEPQRYLHALGWNFVLEANGQITVQRGEAHFDRNILSSGITVNGVITHSYMKGYFTGSLADVLLLNDETVVMMSNDDTTDNDTDGTSGSSNTLGGNSGSVNGNHSSVTINSTAVATQAHTPPTQANDTQTQGLAQTAVPMIAAFAATGQTASPSMLVADSLLNMSDAGQAMAPSPQSEALFPSNFMLPPTPYALDEAFDPLLFNQQDVFDPFEGNQFDAFDWMDGWDAYINADAATS